MQQFIRMPTSIASPVIRPVTGSPGHHFFGYYDKSPWDPTGRWILAMETEFMDRPPQNGEAAVIGLIDTADNHSWTRLASTTAWNWQQGCMLQWLGDNDTGDIIFNDFRDGCFVSRILNIHNGRERIIARPIYGVNRAGTDAVSINFARLHHQRPGYGYQNAPDPWREVLTPEDDGIHAIDLQTGRSRLILSLAEAAAFENKPEYNGKLHRFNHLQFGPNNRRFAVLQRYKDPTLGAKTVGDSRLLTLNLEGKEICCISDHGAVSHYDWSGEDSIVAWARRNGQGMHYYHFQEQRNSVEIVGESVFNCDGHCSFSPDGRWMLTDTYPDDTAHRTLILCKWREGCMRVDIGRFLSPAMDWTIRCDLHPRWSRDGNQVCVDSIHEGSRQMYVVDVREIVQHS